VIVRAWHATATAEGADAYREHFTRAVLPELQRIDGYQGAYLLRRDHDTHVRLQVLTLWDSPGGDQQLRRSEPGERRRRTCGPRGTGQLRQHRHPPHRRRQHGRRQRPHRRVSQP